MSLNSYNSNHFNTIIELEERIDMMEESLSKMEERFSFMVDMFSDLENQLKEEKKKTSDFENRLEELRNSFFKELTELTLMVKK